MADVRERMSAKCAALAPELWVEASSVFRVATGEHHHVDVAPFAFTVAIVTTPIASPLMYDDRWCYYDVPTALAAARTWIATSFPHGEPEGWHRHPATGRRRPDGQAHLEHLAP